MVQFSGSTVDFILRIADAVKTLAAVEQRSELEILADLQETNADVIRIRLKQADAANGTVPLLEHGVPLIETPRS